RRKSSSSSATCERELLQVGLALLALLDDEGGVLCAGARPQRGDHRQRPAHTAHSTQHTAREHSVSFACTSERAKEHNKEGGGGGGGGEEGRSTRTRR